MKAILIDTPNHEVREVDYNGDFRQIYKHIGASTFDVVSPTMVGRVELTVYVDGEGLINGNPHGLFSIAGVPQPLAGYGLVLGCDLEGNSVDVPVSAATIRDSIVFLSHKKEGS